MHDLDHISLYIHIPFCETKCPYCDFNTYSHIEPLIDSYINALIKEINLWGNILEKFTIKTIFFGGGTPSYIPEKYISDVMKQINESFEMDSQSEITLEANPGDFTESKLGNYLENGINRLSIGVQSFDNNLLKLLGRRHTAQDALKSYKMAQSVGFDNISIDLMYGLPNQSLDQWISTINQSTEILPTHISMYCLTLEPGTPFESWVRVGKITEPDPDLAADMYETADSMMGKFGYRHYEISNWALDGRESVHNLAYWYSQPYLGVGPGAHSYFGGYRFSNLKNPREYISKTSEINNNLTNYSLKNLKELLQNIPTIETTELIDKSTAMIETLMMGLRIDKGISISEFSSKFKQTPFEAYQSILEPLIDFGLLKITNENLRLTPKGRILSNEVFSRLFVDTKSTE